MSYDSWKTTPDPEPEPTPENQWGYDPDAESDARYYEDEEDR